MTDSPAHRPLRFRIKVAVTGHRSLENEELVRAGVRRILEKTIFELQPALADERDRSGSHGFSFTALSALAEGADRLVAREILATEGGRLDAVLPLRRDDYLEDFASPESRKEFGELLACAAHVTRTGPPRDLGGDEEDPAEMRRTAYEAGGHFVVNHCDFLVAVWDGQPSRGRGGTAEIVAYAKKRGCPVIVVSSRDGSLDTSGWPPGGGIDMRAVDAIDELNALDPARPDLAAYAENVLADLFDATPEGRAMPASSRERLRETLVPHYARASTLAKSAQSVYKWAGRCVYFFAPLSVAAVACGVLYHDSATWFFLAEFALLALILGVVLYAQSNRCHSRWIEYRFLTEKIRSAIALDTAGFRSAPIRVPPHLGLAHRPNDWMVRVFDEIWAGLPPRDGAPPVDLPTARAFLAGAWVGPQAAYHEGNARRVERRSRWLEFGGFAVFVLALVAALSHAVAPSAFGTHHGDPFEQFLLFLAIVLPGVGAALGGLRSHGDYSRIAKRSEHMVGVLEDLRARIGEASSRSHVAVLAGEAEETLLRETQEWLGLMRFIILEAEL